MDLENTNSEESSTRIGCLSEAAVQRYIKQQSFTPRQLRAFRHIQQLNRTEMAALLADYGELDDRKFYLIKEAGLPAAALLMEKLDIRVLLAATQGRCYIEPVLELDDNPAFSAALTQGERSALRLLANAYRDVLFGQSFVLELK